MMKFTEEELKTIANDFLKESYDLELKIPLKINKRLSKAFGRFSYLDDILRIPEKIEVSQDLVTYHNQEEIIDVLKHECVHYACFILGKPHKDKDAHFKSELARLGVFRTRTHKRKGTVQWYQCTKCKDKFNSVMKGYHKRYIHLCGGKLEHLGEGLINVSTEEQTS